MNENLTTVFEDLQIPGELKLPLLMMLWGSMCSAFIDTEPEIELSQEHLKFTLWNIAQDIKQLTGEQLATLVENLDQMIINLNSFATDCKEELKTLKTAHIN